MQEEVNEKTIALSVKTARMSASVLKAAMRQFLAQQEKAKQKSSARAAQKAAQGSAARSRPPHGRQTMKELMGQNAQLTNIEVTDANIKSFERTARKYQIDFSLKKDASVSPPKYIVFFKAKDVDVMTAAFKEYSARELKKTNKPSLRKRLAKALDAANKHRQKERTKDRDRGQSR